MASDTTVSTIALAVALVALITTISQVIGQFLATADGYRRCQSSVMGQWAILTHRHFRWSEMRFETLYTTPRFGLSPYVPGRQPLSLEKDIQGNANSSFQLDGSPSALKATFCEPSRRSSGTELASWVKLIEALHSNSWMTLTVSGEGGSKDSESKARMGSNEKGTDTAIGPLNHLIPDVMIQQRSWDFVPPEVVRPLAVVSISDIAIMARRLGMIWKQFEPLDGNLRAEGAGHTLSSTIVRSLGTVLDIGVCDPLYSTLENDIISELYVPSEAADMMGFGTVPGDTALDLPNYKIGTEDEVLATLRDVVDPSREAAEEVKSIMEANPGWTPGISDIIGFAAPIIRQPGSSIVRVPAPAGYVVGLTEQEEGFVVFHNRLQDLIADRDAKVEPVSSQTRYILEQYEELLYKYDRKWEDQHECNRTLNNRSITFLDDLHARHTAAVSYFRHLAKTHENFHYSDLMYSHIRHAVNYFEEALELLNADPPRGRDHYGMRVADWITEGAHIYFDNISKIADDMRKNGFNNPEIVEEAWLTMMFKAFLWHRCHFMVEGARVPSSNWGSRLPVYIG